jgi:hypothetical protein
MTANQHSLSTRLDQTRPHFTLLKDKQREKNTRRVCSVPYGSHAQSQSVSKPEPEPEPEDAGCSGRRAPFLLGRSLAARLAPGGDHDQYLLDTCTAATHRILQTTWEHHRSTLHSLTNRLKTRYCSPRSPRSPILLPILSRLPRAPRIGPGIPNNLRLHSPDTPSSLDNLSIFTVLIVVIYSFPTGLATLDASHPIELLLCSRASQSPWHESPPPCFADTCSGATFPLVDVSDK